MPSTSLNPLRGRPCPMDPIPSASPVVRSNSRLSRCRSPRPMRYPKIELKDLCRKKCSPDRASGWNAWASNNSCMVEERERIPAHFWTPLLFLPICVTCVISFQHHHSMFAGHPIFPPPATATPSWMQGAQQQLPANEVRG
jgi:hypothetical protein